MPAIQKGNEHNKFRSLYFVLIENYECFAMFDMRVYLGSNYDILDSATSLSLQIPDVHIRK